MVTIQKSHKRSHSAVCRHPCEFNIMRLCKAHGNPRGGQCDAVFGPIDSFLQRGQFF